MTDSNTDNTLAVIGKVALKIPVPSVVFILAYFLYKGGYDWPATIALFVGLLLCVVYVMDELYRGSIKNLKSDVTYYSKMAKEAHTQSFQSASDSTERVMDMQAKYERPGEISTTSSE